MLIESVKLSFKLNNQIINGRHIRVDKLNPSLFDPKRSLFLSGLPHYCDEEIVRQYFAKVSDMID